jgi:membrane protease YdiL (CAAX protease family)
MEEKNYPGPLEALIVILAVFFLILGGTIIIYTALLLSGQEETELINFKLVYILGALPYIIIPYYYAKYRNYDLKALFRFRAVPLYALGMSLLIGLSMSIVVDELDRIIQIFLPMPEFLLEAQKSLQADTFQDWIILFAGVVIVAAVSEEMVFRGFLQVTLENSGDVTRAVLMTSLAWTMIHTNPWWAIQIFVTGVIIGFLAWRTGSIIPGILVHGMNNFVALIIYNAEAEPEWYTLGDHVSPEILIPALAVLVYTIIKLSDFYKRKADLDLRL